MPSFPHVHSPRTIVRHRSILSGILLLLAVSSASAQLDTLWSGHRAFADGRYDEAMVAYQAAIDQGSSWTWLPDLITAVQVRKDLGAIAPADTHTIGFIYVTELRASSDTGTTVLPDVTKEQKEMWSVYFEVFRQTLESFSGGAWTIRYDTVSATSAYDTGSPLAPDNPDHLDLGPYFFGTMADMDTYITLSNTRSPSRGLARTYPYVNGVLYGPDRGMAAINAGTSGYGGLLHEFFHAIEWVSNAIGMAHGYRDENRSNFPGWTGTTEFDYYRWHFAETLPSVPWRRLNHRTRWMPVMTGEGSIAAIRSVYAAIPFSDRKKADSLTTDGKGLYSTDTLAAVALYEQALALSPYHPETLELLHDHHRFASANTVRRDELFSRLRLVRSATDYATRDTVNAGFGPVVGFWHHEDTPLSWERRTWDLSATIKGTGTYIASFYYTNGWKALDIDSVALFKDGVEVSRDFHRGFSGNAKTDIRYSLALDAYDAAGSYDIRASVRGSGGVDSYGQVHLEHMSTPTRIGEQDAVPEAFGLSQNFPNPFNPTTTIGFTMKTAGHVRLTIRDLLGRDVDVLVDALSGPGRHFVTWNAANVSTGVYVYSLEIIGGNERVFQQTRRMLLVR